MSKGMSMHAQLIKLLSLSGLTAALMAAAGVARADDSQAPTFTAEPCCSLCPAAHDARNYVTRYQQNFTTLVQAQGDWLFRTKEDLRTEFDITPAGARRMQQLHDAFKRKGVELVVVYQPTRGLVDRNKLLPEQRAAFDYDRALKNYQAMLGRFSKMGYWVPDLSTLTNENEAHDFYFRGDQHWTPYGAQRSARIVAETVKKIPGFADIPKREFETKVSGRMGKNGTMHAMAAQLCGNSYAIQYIEQFSTEPKGEAGDGDLFGDSGNPEIALVGTSHSGKNYNFGGFLQEYLGADVLNVAFPGGGLDGSMIEYLGSEDFQQRPPKILIWEFSPLYRLDQETIYRQLMALLESNGCESQPAVLSAKTSLKPGVNEVLVNGRNGIKNIRNGSHQIDIQFADPSVKTLQARLWYMNGRHENIKIEKPNTTETDGRFAFQLRDDQDWADQQLLALEIEGPEAGAEPLKVEAKVCKRSVLPRATQQTAQAGL